MSIPLVLKMEAIETHEEAAWGIRRPGWGRLVEEFGELRYARRAEMVAPVSKEVAKQLGALGVPQDRLLILSCAVDTEVFSPSRWSRLPTGERIDGRLVVGWIGGFRPYHGLELLPGILSQLEEQLPESIVCLVGDGPLHATVSEQLRRFRSLRMIGSVPHDQVARWIQSFDVGLVLAQPGPFHYSPLKLYEYLACGCPVIAASVGEAGDVLSNHGGGVLVPPGDPHAIVQEIVTLASDPTARSRLAIQARQVAEGCGSWEVRALDLLDALKERQLTS